VFGFHGIGGFECFTDHVTDAVPMPFEITSSCAWQDDVSPQMATRGKVQRTGVLAGPGSLALQKPRLPSLVRGRLLRAFSGRGGRLRVSILITERILNILLPFCYPIRWQRTTQADIGWTGVAKIPKENRMLHNWPLRAEMAVAAFRVRCVP